MGDTRRSEFEEDQDERIEDDPPAQYILRYCIQNFDRGDAMMALYKPGRGNSNFGRFDYCLVERRLIKIRACYRVQLVGIFLP